VLIVFKTSYRSRISILPSRIFLKTGDTGEEDEFIGAIDVENIIAGSSKSFITYCAYVIGII
jgi:hypothetical protein